MDALRAEIEKAQQKKQSLGASSGVKKKRWKRKGELEAERKRQYFEEEERYKKEQDLKRLEKQRQEDALTAEVFPTNGDKEGATSASENGTKGAHERVGEPPLNKKEIFRLLRAAGEPVTLFGEGAWERFDRLRHVQLAREEASVGQRNEFQKKMRELRDQDVAEDIYRCVGAELPAAAPARDTGADPGTRVEDATTKEDYVYACIRHYVGVWHTETEQIKAEERRTSKGRFAVATLEQTKEMLKPLIRLLRKRTLKKNILDALRDIFAAVELRQYVKASSIYLEQLAIGNAPWPMGATMVGIHARAAREKIGEDKIAHVMNDEQTRKYIQAVKRLITVAQRHYPTEDI